MNLSSIDDSHRHEEEDQNIQQLHSCESSSSAGNLARTRLSILLCVIKTFAIDKKWKVSPTAVMKYLGRLGKGLVLNCANNGTRSPLFHEHFRWVGERAALRSQRAASREGCTKPHGKSYTTDLTPARRKRLTLAVDGGKPVLWGTRHVCHAQSAAFHPSSDKSGEADGRGRGRGRGDRRGESTDLKKKII